MRGHRKPNHLLREARLRMPSPSGSGRPMSRQELADAINAYLAPKDESEATLDANHIGKLERGTHRWPNDLRREAFRHVLNVTTDREIGFHIVRGLLAATGVVPEPSTPGLAAPPDESEDADRLRVLLPVETGAGLDPGADTSQKEAGRIQLGRSALNAPLGTLSEDRYQLSGDESDSVKRRSLLAAGSVAVVDTMFSTPTRVAQALNVVTPNTVADLGIAADSLDELVSHYSQTVCTLPPTSVYDDLLSVRSYAGWRLDHASRSAQRRSDLAVAAGSLSNLLAVVTSYMGDHGAALVWCSDAERRSQEAGHPELAGWAALTRAMIAYYQGQARHSVALAGRGQEIAPVGTVAYAKLAAQEMRARAMLGDADGMRQAKRRAAKAIARLPSRSATTGVFSITRDEDPPYTATSLLLVRRFEEAVSATNRVIEAVYGPQKRDRAEQPSNYARSLLILGLAEAGLGHVAEAAAAGQAALDGARLVWPTMVLAGKLDQILMRDFADVAETADYHARYADAASRTAGRRPPLAAPPEDRG